MNLDFGFSFLHALNAWANQAPAVRAVAVFFAQGAPYIFAIIFLAIWFFAPKKNLAIRRAVVYAVASGVLGLVAALVISHVVHHTRPEFADPQTIHALVSHGRDSGFPSDHVTGSFAFAVGMAFAGPAVAWPFFALAVIVGFARMAVGVHWPADVLAGAVVGVLAAWLVLACRRYLEWLIRVLFGLFGWD